MVACLGQAGANVDIRAQDGMSALYMAVTRGISSVSQDGAQNAHVVCAKALLAGGADINLEDHKKLCTTMPVQTHAVLTAAGCADTPLHVAAGFGSPELAKLLLSYGMRCAPLARDGICSHSHCRCVDSRLCHDAGAVVDAEDESGQTPLQIGASQRWQCASSK